MSDDTTDGNWLHASVFPCPHCGTALFRVDRSPLSDDYRLYCDRCPNSVEVSYYDDVCRRLDEERRADMPAGWPAAAGKRALIEEYLRPCDWGGTYRFNAARRCPACQQPVVVDEPWVDLFPSINGVEMQDRDPTPEEQHLYERFAAPHIRTHDLWKPATGKRIPASGPCRETTIPDLACAQHAG
jgi:predicted RNA-binding Zn-ribbon protein involved in translation (DUF1610 family)